MIFRGGDVVAESMSDFFRRAQGGEPQPAAVGTFTVDDPDVVGLIGIVVILRKAIPGSVVLAEMLERFLYGGPGVFEEGHILLAGENVILVDHQNEFAVQVFPVIGILPTEGVGS